MGIVTDIILPIALAFIMFSLGLGLTFDDFARVAKRPKDFFAGAFSQIILLPLVALILVSLWPLSPELALGVMIIAAAPGGVTSNLLTSFARGGRGPVDFTDSHHQPGQRDHHSTGGGHVLPASHGFRGTW